MRVRKATKGEFLKIIAAVKAAEDASQGYELRLWRIGHALIAECGPPGRHGVNTGVNEKIRQVAKVLAKLGYRRYGFQFLIKLRQTAAAFPESKRVQSVTWAVHAKAGDPETLRKVVKAAQTDGKPVTVKYVKDFITRQHKAAKDQEHPQDKSKPEDEARQAIAKIILLTEYVEKRIPELAKLPPTNMQTFISELKSAERRLAKLGAKLSNCFNSELREAAE